MKFPNIGFFLYICAVILIITLMGLTNHQILAFSKAVNSSLLIGDNSGPQLHKSDGTFLTIVIA